MLKLRAWDIDRKEMYYIDDLYFFEEEGIHEIENGGIARGHHGTYKITQFSGVYDKNNKEIFQGDLVLGKKSWCDGYLKKKYPKDIIVICEVKFNRGKFYTDEIRAINAHQEANEHNFYREIHYSLNPFLGNIAENLEIVGNVFQHEKLLESL